MRHYSHTYEDTRYHEDQADPFLDACGFDPAGERRHPNAYSYHSEIDAEENLMTLIRRELARPRYHLVA